MNKLIYSIICLILLGSISSAETYTNPGIYTINWPKDAVAVRLDVWGAGGGGGGGSIFGGYAGGGGGGYARRSNYYRPSGVTYMTIVVGLRGVGGIPRCCDGTDGGGSYVINNNNLNDIIVSGGGGKRATGALEGLQGGAFGDVGATFFGGVGGHPLGGSQPANGGAGGGSSAGTNASGTQGSNSLPGNYGANGGIAPIGGGSGGGGGDTANNGTDGFYPGGGGGGAGHNGSSSGDGADGKVIVTFIYES